MIRNRQNKAHICRRFLVIFYHKGNIIAHDKLRTVRHILLLMSYSLLGAKSVHIKILKLHKSFIA